VHGGNGISHGLLRNIHQRSSNKSRYGFLRDIKGRADLFHHRDADARGRRTQAVSQRHLVAIRFFFWRGDV